MESFNSNNRYARQTAIPEIGEAGQAKLKNSKVLIVGCGALGSMVAMQLSGAGVGIIDIVDYDTIEISNLQRQFYFKTEEAGKFKADILKQRIIELNPEVKVKVYPILLTGKNAEDIIKEYDFVVDATDNPESKRLIGGICKNLSKPCCIGGVREFGGQIITLLPQDDRFEDYFGKSENENFLPCSLSGVAGPAAAFCASVQASEAIKYLCGIGKLLSGRLFTFDLLTNRFALFEL